MRSDGGVAGRPFGFISIAHARVPRLANQTESTAHQTGPGDG